MVAASTLFDKLDLCTEIWKGFSLWEWGPLQSKDKWYAIVFFWANDFVDHAHNEMISFWRKSKQQRKFMGKSSYNMYVFILSHPNRYNHSHLPLAMQEHHANSIHWHQNRKEFCSGKMEFTERERNINDKTMSKMNNIESGMVEWNGSWTVLVNKIP